jgi:hypothetical protein
MTPDQKKDEQDQTPLSEAQILTDAQIERRKYFRDVWDIAQTHLENRILEDAMALNLDTIDMRTLAMIIEGAKRIR